MIEHLLDHTIGLAHVMMAVVALIAGTAVISIGKGTRPHRRLGRIYLIAMLAMNATALLDYELYGFFGPFHWMALISLATVLAGYVSVRRRRPGWQIRHAFYMSGSYVGLIAAAVAEVASRVPGWAFGPSVFISSSIVIAVGIRIMLRTVPRVARASS